MKITFHHQGNTAVWEEDTAYISGEEYIIERLLDVCDSHRMPVKLTETGPDVRPTLWNAYGAFAAGLVAGFAPEADDPDWLQVPEGAVP